MKKKTMTLFIALTMILGTAAFAEDISIGEISRPESAYNYSVNGLMTVSEVGEDTILCKQDNGGEIQLNISDETVFIDSNAMTAFNLNELKAGDKIYAEYSEAMTRSIPPQTSATLVASNVEEGGGVELISADRVDENEDGSITVYDSRKDVLVTASKDSSVRPYRTKNRVMLSDIKEGAKLVMWYDIVTMSLPAQAHTDKIVAVDIPNDETLFKVNVEDKEISLNADVYYDGRVIMVPLRSVGEALGYKVGWDEATGAVTIEDANVQKATLFEGTNKVKFDGKLDIIDMSRDVANEKATVINNGCTFVPLKFFKEFMNDTSVNGVTITISPQKAEIQTK